MQQLPGRLVLVGHPVAHSLSPIFQNAALQHKGIPLRYEAFDISPAQLSDAVERLRQLGASGNVTVPHKEAFASLCGVRTPIAERVGAVNTFWTEDGVLVGDNTDVGGFEEAVREAFGAERQWERVAVLGAGGAAAAVLAAVERWPDAKAVLWARSTERGDALRRRFPHVEIVSSAAAATAGADLVVNATPLGLNPADPLPVAVQLLAPHASVFDLVYNRRDTPWVLAARAAGHAAVDGLGMLIAQGALAFERWFEVVPNRDVMWAAVRA